MSNRHDLKAPPARSARAQAFDAFTLRVFRVLAFSTIAVVVEHLFGGR